jgi:hypothetical protein
MVQETGPVTFEVKGEPLYHLLGTYTRYSSMHGSLCSVKVKVHITSSLTINFRLDGACRYCSRVLSHPISCYFHQSQRSMLHYIKLLYRPTEPMTLPWDCFQPLTLLEQVKTISPSGLVPLITPLTGPARGLQLNDSLGILLYLADIHPELAFFPRDAKLRAMCWSAVAEMHSGFSAVRNKFDSNYVGLYSGKPSVCHICSLYVSIALTHQILLLVALTFVQAEFQLWHRSRRKLSDF